MRIKWTSLLQVEKISSKLLCKKAILPLCQKWRSSLLSKIFANLINKFWHRCFPRIFFQVAELAIAGMLHSIPISKEQVKLQSNSYKNLDSGENLFRNARFSSNLPIYSGQPCYLGKNCCQYDNWELSFKNIL